MTTFFKRYLLPALALSIGFMSCRKEAFEEYYGRPDWLASPIYQQLDSMGDFTSFLYCIDLSGYKNTLGSGGSWTVFAPTDEAFKIFMQEYGITDLSHIDKPLAEKIVRAAMVYDAERLERLNDNFSRQGWIAGAAFRRRTVYYDFVEDETLADGKVRKIVSTNRRPDVTYVATDNNNKHVTYFFQEYMQAQQLNASDYTVFYPNSAYTGLNIANARIDPDRSNILAENGYVHLVDRVLAPVESIDQYIRNTPEYSEFKKILNFFATYIYNAELTRKYEVLSGHQDSVFVKGYTALAVALNNENYLKEDPNDAQTNSYAVTVPTNAAVLNYSRRMLLKYYPSGTTIEDLFRDNSTALVEFLNAHFYATQLWPSKFDQTRSVNGETTKVTFDNVIESRLLSNGAFYGVDVVQNADVFRSVYGNVLLDPKYRLMRIGLERVGLQLALRIPSIRYMLVMASDTELYKMGFDYDAYNTSDPIRFRGGNGTPEMRKVLTAHIIPLGADPIPNLNGTGMLETQSGEYIRLENGTITSSGRQDSIASLQTVRVDSSYTGDALYGTINGVAVYANGILTSSITNIGKYFKDRGAENTTSPYYRFFTYLQGSSLYSASDDRVQGMELGLSYTMLIPNNEAIQQAIVNGDLPSSPTTTDPAERERINRFLQYHIVRNSFAIDGKKTGQFQSLARNPAGELMTLTVVANQSNSLVVRGNDGADVSADVSNSNGLAQRTMVHVLNGYLKHGL